MGARRFDNLRPNGLQEAARFAKGRSERGAAAPKRAEDLSFPKSLPAALNLEEAEAEHIRHILSLTKNDGKKAAEILGIDPTTLWRKKKKHGLP